MPRSLRKQTSTLTPIETLTNRLREFLYLPDPSQIYIVLGTVAANILEGGSVYTMLVGPPAAGGSALLNLILGIPRVVEASGVDGKAAFLSGTGTKERASDATGGLLREVGDHGLLVFKDFTSILSLEGKKYAEVTSALRECHDGHWNRPVGTDGGKKLHWAGKLGCIAKCTSVIDNRVELASMGERWIYYRFPDESVWEQSRSALLNSNQAGWTNSLQNVICEYLADHDLSFGYVQQRRNVTDREALFLYRLAQIAVRARSAVERDRYSKEIVGVPEREGETRIAQTLGQLLVGMEQIGVPTDAIWSILIKIALDSMPKMRRVLMEALLDPKCDRYGICPADFGRDRLLSSKGMVLTAEDLEVHGLVEMHRMCKKLWVRLSPWMQHEWKILQSRAF